MTEAPRSPDTAILPNRVMAWLVVAGLVMTVTTLGVIAWATPVFGDAVARTMGLTAFSLANVWFAFETSDERRSIIGAPWSANPTLLKLGGVALVAIVLMSELKILNRILDTVSMTVDQWIVCIAVSLAIIVVAEVKKLLRLGTDEVPAPVTPAPEGAPAAG